jgi:ABC-type lipoprotein export system ATPase subunit
MTLAVRCDGLTAGWPGKVLLRNFNFPALKDFDSLNYALPIIGRTGRGKSTLLYALSGMARPMAGNVSWQFGNDAPTTWSTDEKSFSAVNQLRRRQFGFLLQDASMLPCFTVEENLRHTLRLRGIVTNLDARIEVAMRKMLIPGEDLGDFLPKYPIQLSGGMRQRAALAAAIVHDPVVLFADEPTASLDDDSGREILAAIRGWLDHVPGMRAFVFVTHRVETLVEGAGAREALELYMEDKKNSLPLARWRGFEGTALSKVE